MDVYEVGLQVLWVGEPHVAHGAVIGLVARVAHKVVFELVPAVEYAAADLMGGETSGATLELLVLNMH